MPFTANILRNAVLAAVAVSTTTGLFTATTVSASRGDIYRAELAQPAEDRITFTRTIPWQCEDTSCVAPDSGSADSHVCIWMAREVGTLTSFSAGDRVFTAEELQACNGRS